MRGHNSDIVNCLQVKKQHQSIVSYLIYGSTQVISLSTCMVLFSFIMVVISCTTVTSNKPAAPDLPTTSEKSAEHPKPEYVLQIGDLMDIKFLYDPDLNESVRIRPDGRISLQIVDEVEAAGLTPAQLDTILTERYSRVLTKPEVAVIVREFAGQKIYVGGEVASPGLVNLNSHMTAMEAIFSAGGFRESAEPGSVIILSKSPENTRIVRKVDLKNLMAGSSREPDLFLKPYDVVYVPKTFISKANKFVDQYLTRMVPRWVSVDFSYTRVKQVD